MHKYELEIVNYGYSYAESRVYASKSSICMYMNILNETHDTRFGKDVVYRLLNSPFINWTKFLLTLSTCTITKTVTKLTNEKRINAIVVDDTFYGRLRSKKVELLANVHDHASKGCKFKRGFRLLIVAWTDGVTLILKKILFGLTRNKYRSYISFFLFPCWDKIKNVIVRKYHMRNI